LNTLQSICHDKFKQKWQHRRSRKFSLQGSRAPSPDWTFPHTEIIVATPDVAGNRTVPIVNRKAAAFYLTGYQTQEYFEELDAMTVPAYLLRGSGQGLVIQAVNDSMEDTIFDGDYLICRLVERANWIEIPDFTICVVVTESRGIQVKRVKNRLTQDRLLRLSSGNRRYPSFNVFAEDIHQIWLTCPTATIRSTEKWITWKI
jgi:SOS-response transcriptional repressor LexA